MKKIYTLISLFVFVFAGQNVLGQTYCSSSATSTTYGYIQQVDFNTISQSSSTACGQQYTDNTSQSTTVNPGMSYPITINVQGCSGGSWTHSTKVWIDFNQNGSFTDPGEEVISQGGHQYGPVTGNVTIPVTAAQGSTRMRVVTVETSLINNVNSCGTFTWGETEDYTVDIQGMSPDDAGVIGLAEPSGSSCAGPQNVVATIENFGTDPLNSVTVNWEVGGNLQTPVTVTPNLASWQGTGTTTANVFLGTYNFQNPADADIKAWTTQPNGVADTNNFNDTATATVDVNFAVIQVVQASDMLCADEANGQAIVTSLGGTPPFEYFWSTGDTGSTVNTLPEGTHQVLLIDGIGCRDSIDVTINAPDSMLVDLEKGGITCKGSNNGFAHISVKGGQKPYNFNWSNGMKRQNINNVPPGQYAVTVTDDLGCTSTQNVDIVTVPILRSQLDSVTPANCSQNAGSAYLTANGGLKPYSYNWPGGLSGRTQTGLAGGTYEVTIADAGGCEDITIVKVPDVDLSVTFERPTFFADFDDATTYQWYDCDNDILLSGETFQDFTPANPGNYAVILTYEGCTDTSGCHYVAYTNAEDKTKNAAEVNVYPNPNNGLFNVSFDGNNSGVVKLELYDLNGKLIQSREVNNPGNGYVHQVQESLSSGMYLLKVQQRESTSLHRVVVK